MPTGIQHEHGHVLRQGNSGPHEKGEHDHEPGKDAHEYTLVVGAVQQRRLRSIARETAVQLTGTAATLLRPTNDAGCGAPRLRTNLVLGARLAGAKTWRHR